MKIKTEDLEGIQLDVAVAIALEVKLPGRKTDRCI
jgi:hypothetical protein